VHLRTAGGVTRPAPGPTTSLGEITVAQTTKKTAAKKTASDNDESTEQPTTGRAGDSGPGTGVDAPAEDTARMPAETVNTDPESAPLDPPADAHTQGTPEHGYAESTTDQTYAESGGRTIAGENHVALVGEDGESLNSGDLFDDQDTNKTFVVTKTRIYEQFTYPNTSRVATRLYYAAGRRVPRFQAERIKAAVDAGR
jgi:hypothetical protein